MNLADHYAKNKERPIATITIYCEDMPKMEEDRAFLSIMDHIDRIGGDILLLVWNCTSVDDAKTEDRIIGSPEGIYILIYRLTGHHPAHWRKAEFRFFNNKFLLVISVDDPRPHEEEISFVFTPKLRRG